MAAEGDSIVETAEARRERLKALRRAQELFETPDEDDSEAKDQADNGGDTNDESLNMKFRNYLPQDKELQGGRLAPPELPKFEDPVAPAPPSEKNEDPFLNIAPKNPNWDLKRDVQKKLDKLERRTQKALVKLMEEQEKQQQAETEAVVTKED